MQGAVDTMATLNKGASQAMTKVGVHACTDITGFGLMGHLKSMVKGSGVCAEINLAQVPTLPGTWELLGQGIAPGGTGRNRDSVADTVRWHPDLSDNDQLLLCDAQTSGGLLMSVAADREEQLLAELTAAGTPCAAVVGRITDGPAGTIVASP